MDSGTALERLAHEASAMATGLETLQNMIGELLSDGTLTPDARDVQRLQDLDRITQTLGDFATIASNLGRGLGGIPVRRETLIEGVRLESMRHALIAD